MDSNPVLYIDDFLMRDVQVTPILLVYRPDTNYQSGLKNTWDKKQKCLRMFTKIENATQTVLKFLTLF